MNKNIYTYTLQNVSGLIFIIAKFVYLQLLHGRVKIKANLIYFT